MDRPTYPIPLPSYAIAMTTVILTYLTSIKSIFLTNTQVDKHSLHQNISNAKKLILVFFNIGVCWLFLILSMVIESGLGVDWVFVIFKTIQAGVLLWACCSDKIRVIFGNIRGKYLAENEETFWRTASERLEQQ